MASSILHRFSGIGLYAGAAGFALWLIAAALGPDAYGLITPHLSAWYGQAILYLLVAALAYHLANGIRHLVFDTGSGLTPADANASAWFAILATFAAPAALWAALNYGS